jgi:hydroxyacylglutathione hydrolase
LEWIHKLDSQHSLCRGFTFDDLFETNYKVEGIEAFHVAGHTPGFTFYIFEDVLLICDYVFRGEGMVFNPFGPERETKKGGEKINKILENRQISRVCGSHYIADYSEWKEKFDKLLKKE